MVVVALLTIESKPQQPLILVGYRVEALCRMPYTEEMVSMKKGLAKGHREKMHDGKRRHGGVRRKRKGGTR